MTVELQQHRTAIARGALSRPVSLAIGDGLLTAADSFFDYGCGRGGDVERLAALGFRASGWDPAFRPDADRTQADVVNFGYVANVIESPQERAAALRGAWALAKRLLVVAARIDWEARGIAGRPFGDGILTGNGTFQRYYSQEELRSWIDGVLDVRSVAATPGIFYVFRELGDAHGFLAARVRRRTPAVSRRHVGEALYEANRVVLAPLEAFILARGRVPDTTELPEAADIAARFGSLQRAAEVIRRVTGDEAWERARHAAREDLLVFLALAAFGGRPKLSALPTDLQRDVKACFGSYREACTSADLALFAAGNQDALDRACREAPVGKLMPDALYVHVSAISRLTPLLRIYEGCGRALTGAVEGATLVKLYRDEPKIAYLAYPDFDRKPHPPLATSVRANLRRLAVRFTDFRTSTNPPILHRKETFVDSDYPKRVMFARLSAQEERAGLLADSTTIGMRAGWERALAAHRVSLRGHRLLRQPSATHSAAGP